MTINKRFKNVMETRYSGTPEGASGNPEGVSAMEAPESCKNWQNQAMVFPTFGSDHGIRNTGPRKYDETWLFQDSKSAGKNIMFLITKNYLDNLFVFKIQSYVNYLILQCLFKNSFTHNHRCKNSKKCSLLKNLGSTSMCICCDVNANRISIWCSNSLSSYLKIEFGNENCIIRKMIYKALKNNIDWNFQQFKRKLLQLESLSEFELESLSELLLSQSTELLTYNNLSAWLNPLQLLEMTLTVTWVLDKENVKILTVNNEEIVMLRFVMDVKCYKNCDNNDQSCYCKGSPSQAEAHNFDWSVNKDKKTIHFVRKDGIKPKTSVSSIFYSKVSNFFLRSDIDEMFKLGLNYNFCLCQIKFTNCDNSLFTFVLFYKSQSLVVFIENCKDVLTTCAKVNSISRAEKNIFCFYLIIFYFLLETIIFRNTSYSDKLITHKDKRHYCRSTLLQGTLLPNAKKCCTETVCGFMIRVCYKIQILLEIITNHKFKLSFTILFNLLLDFVCHWSKVSPQMFFNQQILISSSVETSENNLHIRNSLISKVKSNSNVLSKVANNKLATKVKKSIEMYHIVFLFRVCYVMSILNCNKNVCKRTICARINFPGSELYFCAFFSKTNNRKNNFFDETDYSIQQHAISTERSKSNYANADITGKDGNTLPSKGKSNKHKIQESSSLQNLSSKISFPLLFYYHCVNITFNERPEFRGQFSPTIKRRQREKTKYCLELEETKHAIKRPEDSLEKRSRRKFKEHSKYGGTILTIRLPLFLAMFCYLIAGGSASCPRLCSCKWKGGKQTVECINKGLTTIPSDIDPGTQVLDMTGNPLVIISREKFKIIGLTNLQRIYATRCKLVQLDDSAFRGLSNLVELDLSINELRVVPAATLQYLPSLMRLQLSFNPITHIKDGSFRGLAYLTSLELTGCAIHTLESLAFQGLDRLEWLKINDNNMTTVPPKMMLPKSLHGVDMHNNPWTCDCKLRQLRQWLVQYNVPSSIEPKCAGPMRLRNRIIKEVIPSDLACAPDMRPTSFFLDIIEGKNVSLECHVTAVPDAEVQWLFNGYPLENSTFAYEDATSLYVYEDKELDENKISYLRIETVTEAHSGIFQCVAENKAGRTISNFTLRVSLPPTKPAPSVPPMNHIVYIGTALISLVVLVIILFCILIIRCCRRRSKNVKNKSNPSIIIREKQLSGDRPKSNNMPKYIQMGTPAPKINGILADTPPISVIENSPYRTEPVGSTHINPDIIADGPDDRPNTKPAKKKVSIVGVEEMDANGTIITRKLDDIIEEGEDNFDPTYEKIQVRNGYENTQSLLNNHYMTLTRQQMESATNNQYPLTELPPDQVPQQNVRFYDQQGFAVDYVLPREQWQEGTGRMDHIIRYSSPVPSDQSPLYATIRRNREEMGVHSNLLHDQKYPEEYNLRECNPQFPAPDMRYQQNYGLVSAHKKICEGGNSFCECCQPTTSNPPPSDYDSLEPMGRMRGDGCSFDHLLTSCGGQCCYDEKTGQLFDNTLPENYRPLEENPPPPPEGYGDSEDEVDVTTKSKEWGDCALSPGTRILYSPQEEQFNGTHNEQQPINGSITNV